MVCGSPRTSHHPAGMGTLLSGGQTSGSSPDTSKFEIANNHEPGKQKGVANDVFGVREQSPAPTRASAPDDSSGSEGSAAPSPTPPRPCPGKAVELWRIVELVLDERPAGP